MLKKRKAVTLFGVLAIEGVILFILCAVWAGVYTTGICKNAANPTTSPIKATETTASNQTAAIKRNSSKGHGSQKIHRIYKSCKKYLVLVNAQHALNTSYEPKLLPICRGRLSASKYIYDSLEKMLSDAAEEGYQFWIASAYRNREKQQRLIGISVPV